MACGSQKRGCPAVQRRYTMTPDGMFILDVLPRYPEVAIFAGGCGRAFKFGILLGRFVLPMAVVHSFYCLN